MSKSKLLVVSVILLAILNVGLLIFILLGHPDGRRPEIGDDPKRADEIAREFLNFDDNQIALFSESREVHSLKITSLREELRKTSNAYYNSGSTDYSKRDSLLLVINALNEKVYLANLSHFDDLRKIGYDTQQEQIDNFIKRLMTGGNHHRRKLH